jgi:hypothetical protein
VEAGSGYETLAQAAEAHRLVEAGGAKSKIVFET